MWIWERLFGTPVEVEWMTVSLPLTATGAKVLAATLGLMAASALVWLMLNAPDRGEKRRDLLSDWLTALGWVLLPFWFLLLAGTLWHLWLLFSGLESFLDNVGFGMGAVVAAFLGGPFVIWGAVLKHRTVEFQKEGHITDRISKAVEQLGAEKTVKDAAGERTVPNIEVRIGGLLSLERIAQDSTAYDKGRDHVRVMEILCAYVRENAKAEDAVDFPLPEWEPLKEDASEEERLEHEGWRTVRFLRAGRSNVREWTESLPTPREDISLALQIIGRRGAEQRRVEARWGADAHPGNEWVFDDDKPSLPESPSGRPLTFQELDAYENALTEWKEKLSGYHGYLLDFRGANLQKADLSKLVLSGAQFVDARLEGANLKMTRLEGADLRHARMDGAHLAGVVLSCANLRNAGLESAFMNDAVLEGADLDGAQCAGAYCRGALMVNANLWDTVFEGAFLRKARLERTKWLGAHLENSDLEGAHMDSSDFSYSVIDKCFLIGTILGSSVFVSTTFGNGTILEGAKLDGSVFGETNLSRVHISKEQLEAVFADGSVILPAGMDWPKHWPVWVLHESGEHNFFDEYRKWLANPDTYTPPPPPEQTAD